MKRVTIVLLALTLAGAAAVVVAAPSKQGGGVVVPVPRETSLEKILNTTYTKAELEAGTYVGSYTCLSCHRDKEAYTETLHQKFIRRPMGKWTLQSGAGVMAKQAGGTKDDFMVGLDLNESAAFAAQKPNAPVLSYDAATDTYYMTVGTVKMRVVATLAGYTGGSQRYMVRIPVSDTPNGWSNSVYFSPATFNDATKKWAVASATTWWVDGKNTPVLVAPVASSAITTTTIQAQNYMKTCSGCHITGIREVGKWSNGEYMVKAYPALLYPEDSPYFPDLNGDGRPVLADIGCEMCHGPGSAHVEGHGDKSKIVNPEDIVVSAGYQYAHQARAAVCLQCHVQTGSAPTQLWGFTYDETNNKPFRVSNPMDDLTKYQKTKSVKWPDGVSYLTARIDSFYSAPHYQGSHGFACNDCHDAHEETMNPAQVRDSMTRSGVTTENASIEDDSFCLSCHAGRAFPKFSKQDVADWKAEGFDAPIPDKIRDAVEEHTHHPYAATRSMGLSNCLGCHMAPQTNHAIWLAKPEDTIRFKDSTTGTATGNPNSCSADCHRGKAIVWSDVPANLTPTDTKYGTDNEVKLANHLVKYFGPGGLWWDTAGKKTPKDMMPSH